MEAQIIRLLKEGRTNKQICAELGCAKSTVSYYSKRAGFISPNLSVKTSLDVIEQAKVLYAEGLSAVTVASRLGVSKSTIIKYVETRPQKGFSVEQHRENRKVSVVAWRVRAKAKLIEYKGGKCELCGYNKCQQALEFHHLDPAVKEFALSGKTTSFELQKVEADKCLLVCANCHREIHAGVANINN